MSMCSICRADEDATDVLHTTECGHSYHSECINRWLATAKTCPLCRQKIGRAPESRRAKFRRIGSSMLAFGGLFIMFCSIETTRCNVASVVDVLAAFGGYAMVIAGVHYSSGVGAASLLASSDDFEMGHYLV